MNLRDEFFVFSSPFSGPVRDGQNHWAGAQRPRAETADKNLMWQAARASEKPLDGRPPQSQVGNCGNKIVGGKNLDFKLREQARKLGLKPGTSRWRAYVLGTPAAMKKRKREKAKEGRTTGYVTPG